MKALFCLLITTVVGQNTGAVERKPAIANGSEMQFY
jgi:hypothetical protein